jgi:hypothetical protein
VHLGSEFRKLLTRLGFEFGDVQGRHLRAVAAVEALFAFLVPVAFAASPWAFATVAAFSTVAFAAPAAFALALPLALTLLLLAVPAFEAALALFGLAFLAGAFLAAELPLARFSISRRGCFSHRSVGCGRFHRGLRLLT